jgi:hypothetical protein
MEVLEAVKSGIQAMIHQPGHELCSFLQEGKEIAFVFTFCPVFFFLFFLTLRGTSPTKICNK